MHTLDVLWQRLANAPTDEALQRAIVDYLIEFEDMTAFRARLRVEAEMVQMWRAAQMKEAAEMLADGSEYRTALRNKIRDMAGFASDTEFTAVVTSGVDLVIMSPADYQPAGGFWVGVTVLIGAARLLHWHDELIIQRDRMFTAAACGGQHATPGA